MKPLPPPASLFVQAADGWLELGDLIEAEAELEKISRGLQKHPDVLEIRWHILARRQKWDECLTLSRRIMREAPERLSGWLNFSFALHELKRTREAWDNLFAVAGKFSSEPTVAYNLACYAAQLGRLWESEQWLKQTFKVGNVNVFKKLALEDDDLKPIRDRIESLAD